MFGFLKKKLANFSEKLKKNIVEEDDSKKKDFEKTTDKEIKKNVEDAPKKTKKELKKNIKEEEQQRKEIKQSNEKLIIKNEEDEKEIVLEEELNKNDYNQEKEINEKENIFQVKNAFEDKRELKAKIGTTTKIKSFFSKQVEIKETAIEELIFELELSLIESDVEQDTAREIVEQIRKKLVGQKVSSKNINDYLKEIIKDILKDMMKTNKIDLLDEIKNNSKPYKIILLGPNGAGKTTTIAKLTRLLQKNGFSCVWAACDTFRSGAIDQLSEHAEKLGVKVIKQQYGADPAAVAFDAIKSAEANKTDVILIDTAGRQETNKNLMEELKKIERVAKPDMKVYVGEAYTGQGLLEMANEFDKKIGINAFVLTKIDTDAKGGTTISLLYKLKKPILFVGTGQEYDDFEEFKPEFILNRII